MNNTTNNAPRFRVSVIGVHGTEVFHRYFDNEDAAEANATYWHNPEGFLCATWERV